MDLYDRRILLANGCYRIPPGTNYILFSTQKNFFSLNIIKDTDAIHIPFTDPVETIVKSIEDIYDKPLKTPYIEDLHESSKNPELDLLFKTIQPPSSVAPMEDVVFLKPFSVPQSSDPIIQQQATFHEPSIQEEATFHEPSMQQEATFHEPSMQQEATFYEPPMQQQATFYEPPMQQQVTLKKRKMFHGKQKTFHEQPLIQQATLNQQPLKKQKMFHDGQKTFHEQPVIQQETLNQQPSIQTTLNEQPSIQQQQATVNDDELMIINDVHDLTLFNDKVENFLNRELFYNQQSPSKSGWKRNIVVATLEYPKYYQMLTNKQMDDPRSGFIAPNNSDVCYPMDLSTTKTIPDEPLNEIPSDLQFNNESPQLNGMDLYDSSTKAIPDQQINDIPSDLQFNNELSQLNGMDLYDSTTTAIPDQQINEIPTDLQFNNELSQLNGMDLYDSSTTAIPDQQINQIPTDLQFNETPTNQHFHDLSDLIFDDEIPATDQQLNDLSNLGLYPDLSDLVFNGSPEQQFNDILMDLYNSTSSSNFI